MVDPFAQMARTLAGTAPPQQSPAVVAGARLARAAAVLRASGDPEALPVAAALERWLEAGGDLAALLGAKGRRGGRHELPHNRRARAALEAELRGLVAEDDGSVPDPRQAAKVLEATLHRMPIVVSLLRERTGVATVPTSEKSLVRILRGTKP